MDHPFALWALPLALVPWLLLLRRPRANIPQIVFPAVFLLSSRRARRRWERRRVLRAALRSLALASLALLWANPHLPDAPTPSLSEQVAAAPQKDARNLRSILVVDGSDSSDAPQEKLTSARILTLALNAQLDDVRVDRVASLEFALRPDAILRGVDATLVVDVSSLARKEEDALALFAKTGSVVIWPGSQFNVARWNKTLERWNVDARITDSTLKDAPAVGATPEERAFLDAFPGGASASIDALPCDRAIAVAGPDATPILRDRRTRTPVFSRLANGICWFAFSPEPGFGALTAAPAFPALVEATTRYPLEPRDITAPVYATNPTGRDALAFLLWTFVLLAAFVELVPGGFGKARRAPALKDTPNAL